MAAAGAAATGVGVDVSSAAAGVAPSVGGISSGSAAADSPFTAVRERASAGSAGAGPSLGVQARPLQPAAVAPEVSAQLYAPAYAGPVMQQWLAKRAESPGAPDQRKVVVQKAYREERLLEKVKDKTITEAEQKEYDELVW